MPVQPLNQTARDEIYRRTLAAVKGEIARVGGDPDDPAALLGQCLEFAWQGYLLIKGWPGAPRTVIQGGSAQWTRVPPEMDDGVSPTHFAYVWDPEAPLTRLARQGVLTALRRPDGQVAPSLPEMHVWLGCPDTNEVIDFTVGFWPAACKALTGLEWPAPLPPDYLWCLGPRRPRRVNYIPDGEAVAVAVNLLRRQGRDYP